MKAKGIIAAIAAVAITAFVVFLIIAEPEKEIAEAILEVQVEAEGWTKDTAFASVSITSEEQGETDPVVATLNEPTEIQKLEEGSYTVLLTMSFVQGDTTFSIEAEPKEVTVNDRSPERIVLDYSFTATASQTAA